ncbi:MAG: transposase [Parachlamydiales bacterium]|jgi:putative transposase
MLFRKNFQFCLEPKKKRLSRCCQFSGAKRWLFNHGLFQRKELWEKEKKKITLFDQNNELVLLKQDPKLSWLKEIHSQVLQQTLADLDRAFGNFFMGLKNKEKIGYPRFKCKGVRDSFRYPQGVKVKGDKVYLPKIGWVRFRKSREIEGKIKQTTVLREDEKWYVTFSCEIEKEAPHPLIDPKKKVGIDLGLTCFATLAIGEKNYHVTIENPKFLRKSLKKLRFLSAALSHKKKHSQNRYKAQKRLNSFHSHLKHQRLDFFYKLALGIVKSHDIISVETMNIKGMLQGLRTLSRAISEVGWGEFLSCLKNKALEYGKTLYEVSSFLASSRLCSKCGRKNKIALGQREYVCECGQRIDRDLNAAINIKAAGASV